MSNIEEAIKKEEIDNLRTLLPHISCTEKNKNLIFLAISHHKPKSAQEIFSFCGDIYTNSTNEYGDTPLKTAIYAYKDTIKGKRHQEKALQTLELTIHNSDNINVKDQYYNTPIATAAFLNLPEAVSLFLKNNANWTIPDDTGNNALDKALWSEHKEIVQRFFAHNESLKDLPTLHEGQTPLTKMIYEQKLEMVRFLLENNVSTRAPSLDGSLPIDIAKEIGNQGILGILQTDDVDL